ncbi:AraC family transcriptional regulator [Hymenobacter sp. ASUV-10]|uniref:AraC family transcriptional regulator n=1 Tax=Hymenobacter aranciens TaxID=3063996 RepID=A0ABT9B677_9BACT|nr:AraC family transcriptional regulator [Hymenobacter sp. ASUV-10]MDO7873772.1 AraC family transcriptional regulator [Hymenobacter sp. ASUV-10]
MTFQQQTPYADILLACGGDQRYGGESSFEDNVLVSVLAGELRVVQASHTRCCPAGSTVLLPRKQPTTLLKYPKDGAAYHAIVMKLPTALVRDYYTRNSPAPTAASSAEVLVFAKSPLLQSLFASLLPYLELEQPLPDKLLGLKISEVLEVLRSLDPRSDAVLADFAEPGKIDLVAFMETHYMFNLPLARFSYLTGRSLTTFKRDFKKAFQLSPQRWLTQKRLALAHYQLAERQRKPVELYLEVGFENLAHFSYAFKKQFGYPPTALVKPAATGV